MGARGLILMVRCLKHLFRNLGRMMNLLTVIMCEWCIDTSSVTRACSTSFIRNQLLHDRCAEFQTFVIHLQWRIRGERGSWHPQAPINFLFYNVHFFKSHFVSECFKIKLREHQKPDSFVSWESSPGESSGGVVLRGSCPDTGTPSRSSLVSKSQARTFSRNWVGRGYLAAVAGSTWLLRDLRRAYCGRLSRTLRNIHAIYTSHSIRVKSFYVALTQRLRVKLYLHS